MKPYSEKTKQADQSEMTAFFASLTKVVDKLHFRYSGFLGGQML